MDEGGREEASELPVAAHSLHPDPQQQREPPAIARIKLTSWSRDVYEPSDDSFALVDAVVAASERWKQQGLPRMCVAGCRL